jgi:hypothetical protein
MRAHIKRPFKGTVPCSGTPIFSCLSDGVRTSLFGRLPWGRLVGTVPLVDSPLAAGASVSASGHRSYDQEGLVAHDYRFWKLHVQ